MSEPAYAQRHEVDPRIFSRVYLHISQHRGTADTGILLDLISAISLDRSASYFEVLERLEPSTRDLGLELLKAKLHGAFPPEAWEDAHQFARELNQRDGEVIRQDSATPGRGSDSPPALRRQEPKREARHSAGSLTIVSKSAATRTPDPVTATAAKSADFESRSGRGLEQRARRPFRQRTRTALAYISVYGGFDGFKYLWGAAAAATVIGLFVLVVAFDERVFDRRFEELASWLSEPVESPPQIRQPVISEVDTTPTPEQTLDPVITGVNTLAAPTPEQPPEGAPNVLSEESVLAEEPRPIADEPSAVEDDKIAITPPLASATESTVPENSLLPQDVPLSAPPQEPTVEQAVPAVIASEPPKPAERAVPQKAKPASKVRSKPAKPFLAKKPVLPPNQPNRPTIETAAPVVKEAKSKTLEAPPVAEPPAVPAFEKSTPPAAAVGSANEAASVEKPRSDAAPPRLEPVSDAQPREKVIANPSFVERLMGFKPGERIARIQSGRQANQPHFIRQLEGVGGPPEGGAEAAAK